MILICSVPSRRSKKNMCNLLLAFLQLPKENRLPFTFPARPKIKHLAQGTLYRSEESVLQCSEEKSIELG
jgi:hypothetical protein